MKHEVLGNIGDDDGGKGAGEEDYDDAVGRTTSSSTILRQYRYDLGKRTTALWRWGEAMRSLFREDKRNYVHCA